MSSQERKKKSNALVVKKKSTNSPVAKSVLKPATKTKMATFPLVAIGASAGGLEALQTFFQHMPTKEKIAFIVVTHLDRAHFSLLPQLLQQVTQLKVVPISNKMEVKPGIVYVIPPNKSVTIEKNILILLPRPESNDLQLPINTFFKSLAQESNRKRIAIILSGAGTDGTLGIEAIHQANGLVIAQDPNTAKYPSMPNSAIDTNFVDYVLPPERIPRHLLNYLSGKIILDPNSKKMDKETLKWLPPIFHLLKTHVGHDFSLYKYNTICRRIEKRMQACHIDNIEEYTNYLRQNVSEIDLLFKDLLINVTDFFRDPEAFEKIKHEFIQLIRSKPKGNCFRIWVPACSTGQEAYSLAMLIQEYMEETHQDFKIQIFGTDVDDEAIEIARLGIYPLSISQHVSDGRLKRFFINEGKHYKICKDIRKMVIFARQNLIKDPPFTKIDILSCRNFLIYITRKLQNQLISLFHYSLTPEGILFLGPSENICNFTELFKTVDSKWKIFICQKIPGLMQAPLHFDNNPATKPKIHNMTDGEKLGETNVESRIEKILLQDYTPACIVVDEKSNIIYFHGKLSNYLQPKSGLASLNILEMTHPDLKEKLVSAIRQVDSRKKKQVSYNDVQIESNNSFLYINLRVLPFKEMEQKCHWKLIIIEECSPVQKTDATNIEPVSTGKFRQQIINLEQELKNTKENLQMTTEEMETSNEEIKSSNEELQSSNEELQSTNEELETSKEELQSLNEELTTVNTELELRIEELSKTNDDIKNLLHSTEIAVIFLDNNLKVKRFTPKSTELISLIQADIGRSLGDIVSTLRYDTFIDDIKEVLNTLSFKITEVQNKEKNCWYQIRIMPYRTVNNAIDGAVITFLNVTKQKQAEMFIKQLQEETNAKLSQETTSENAKK